LWELQRLAEAQWDQTARITGTIKSLVEKVNFDDENPITRIRKASEKPKGPTDEEFGEKIDVIKNILPKWTPPT